MWSPLSNDYMPLKTEEFVSVKQPITNHREENNKDADLFRSQMIYVNNNPNVFMAYRNVELAHYDGICSL